MKLKTGHWLLFCLIAIAFLLSGKVLAQTKIQVVTKTITRKLDLKSNTHLRITGEKAKVSVKGWDKNYIGVTIKLTGKHPDREVAEKELERLKFYLKQNGNLYDLGNYFLVAKGTDQVQANLKAEFEVLVPDFVPVTISCKFGEVNMQHTKGTYEIALEYSLLNLEQVEGKMTIESTFSDVKSQRTNLDLKCNAEKADLDFDNAAGSYQLDNSYGRIRLAAANGFRALKIHSSRTEVSILTKNATAYNLDLTTTYAGISLPEQAKVQIKQASGGKITYQNLAGKNLPEIKVVTTFSPISIQNQGN